MDAHGAIARISLSAVQHNLQQAKRLAPSAKAIAVVKANAYGHGDLMVASALQPLADMFGVARFEEAQKLRSSGIKQPILLLSGFLNAEQLQFAALNNFQVCIHEFAQLAVLETTPLAAPITAWIKIDSGMHRIGFSPEQADAVFARVNAITQVVQPVNAMTHFAQADEPEQRSITETAIARFQQATAGKVRHTALCNSAGVMAFPQAHSDFIRPGIMLYGITPFAEQQGSDVGLRPAMDFTSSLIAVREHKAGEPIGYGASWVSPRDTRIGVIAVGYGDGYPRMAPAGTPVLVNGRRVPLVGRVAMDMATVDLGPEGTEQVGDEVILWGNGLAAEEVARHVGTIAYELVTRLTARPKLEYVD
ncbi:alanine racemase [Oceanisphaera pacifica]|uniref:Alanine racemase n=1 Tax=Oceanisphaera pacifica TaxID=2818389 RepID=A0ABS3NBV7_9GAMM|nr:alanine racemase [Oceanisphaera pacifica]MBO1518076.1 alanine racemase [Oceanisphaera pacifica]